MKIAALALLMTASVIAETVAEHIYAEFAHEQALQVSEEQDKFDPAGMNTETHMQGILDGGSLDRVVYTIMITFGAILLFFSYPATFYNEKKYKNLTMNN